MVFANPLNFLNYCLFSMIILTKLLRPKNKVSVSVIQENILPNFEQSQQTLHRNNPQCMKLEYL